MRLNLFVCAFLSALVIFSSTASAATIKGTVYDWTTLTPEKNAMIEIDTSPNQLFVSKDGAYLFDVPKGNYTIKATYYKSGAMDSQVTEAISVQNDGIFTIDLVLMPVYPEIDTLNETEIAIDSDILPQETYSPVLIAAGLLMVLITFYILYRVLAGKKPVAGFTADKPVAGLERIYPEASAVKDPELKKITDYIEKSGGRATQKDVRKIMPLSEAKVSLMIAELEDRKIIRKIKKGRGNILVLER